MDATSFWANVKVLIKSVNTTQEGIAKACDISFNTLQSWIKNDRLPDVVSAYKISQVLGTTVEYLVTGTESNKTAEELAELKTRLTKLSAQLAELSK